MWLLRFLPRSYLSHLFGKAAYLRLPAFLQLRVLHAFARAFRVNLSESEKPLEEYPSLGDFFVRNLKPGLRTIGEGIVSPVDGELSEFGPISGSTLLQAKGKTYTIEELLRNSEAARAFDDGYFVTLYLAPGDYHHIHSPADGAITEAFLIEGTLWPVNAWSLQRIDRLFCVNERIVSLIQTVTGKIAVVKVGATNVGSVITTYSSAQDEPLVGNMVATLWRRRTGIVHRRYSAGIPVKKGARIGTFRLGSTVILLFQKDCFKPGSLCVRGPIRLGTILD